MKYKISYLQDFDNEGYVYKQRINCEMTAVEFERVNKALNEALRDGFRYARQVFMGKNYTNATTSAIFCCYFGINKDERLLCGRNNIINIKII